MMSKPERVFPNFAWAWPDGPRLLLLHAALNPNDTRARQSLTDWLADNDLDDAGFPEHRLFAAITTRFGRSLDDLAEYPRLVGMQRLHWTLSRLAVSANLPPLQALVDAGLKVVLLKGAARVALDPTQQKSRTAFDLDLVLSDADFETAVGMLVDDGWQSSRGESAMGLKARVSSVRARNLKKGRYGDIDLHRCAYQYVHAHPKHDADLIKNAMQATYYDVPIFIPAVEERLVMAMGHGAWDGHHHSDWLVDIVEMLNSETVDWDQVQTIAQDRNLRGPVAIALSFLANEIGIEVPQNLLARFGADRPRAKLRDIPSLILARDEQDLSAFQTRVRAIVHQTSRIRKSGRKAGKDTRQFRTLTRKTTAKIDRPVVESHVVDQPPDFVAGRWRLDADLLFETPEMRRRIELEINSPVRNLCHVQVLHVRKVAGTFAARFKIELSLDEADFPLTLASLNSKFSEAPAGSPERIKYDRLLFCPQRLELLKK